MITITTDKISKVKFKFPELMSEDAENTIKQHLHDINELEEKIRNLRTELYNLEEDLRKKEKQMRALNSIIEIEYETKEVEEINNEASFGIRGMGNDSLGEKKMV